MSATAHTRDSHAGTAAVASPPRRRWSKKRALAALDALDELDRHILERRGGVPIDVDSVLDEMRGRTD